MDDQPRDTTAADGALRVTVVEPPEREPEDRIALCLSGGGYRAMLFHVGTLWRLNQAGMLPGLHRLSSVSGGSIAAGVLALHWHRLLFNDAGVATNFQGEFVARIRQFASTTVDAGAIILGVCWFRTVGQRVAAAYRKRLFGDATLQDLPDEPEFVFNATNVQSGALWRFMKRYMRDWRVGEVKSPTVPLAAAVAASSAFPPVLSPVVLKLDPATFTPCTGTDLQREPFTSRVVLTDGGVYDNLGLETVWKRYTTILVSDAGGKMAPSGRPAHNWASHSVRILDLIDNQVRSLRKRQLIGAYKAGGLKGTYWGIRSDIANYALPDTLDCPEEKTLALADTPTRLKAMPVDLQKRLINWGYAICDAALRKHYDPTIPPPKGFPYPELGV